VGVFRLFLSNDYPFFQKEIAKKAEVQWRFRFLRFEVNCPWCLTIFSKLLSAK